MKSPDPWRPIAHRSPSRTAARRVRCALSTVHGIVFKNPERELDQEFIPTNEVAMFFGDADSYVAHRLLSACGYAGMVEEEER